MHVIGHPYVKVEIIELKFFRSTQKAGAVVSGVVFKNVYQVD